MADDITIQIGARNKAKKVLDDVRRDVGGLQKQFRSISGTVKGFFGAFAGAATAQSLLSGVADSLQQIDETAKAARKLGLVTDDLIGLRLAAAEFSGMAGRQVDVALQRMTRRLSEAADKSKQVSLTMDGTTVQLSGVRKAIDDLGLSAEELNRAGPAAAFSRIADAIQAVENPADRLRIAFTLFDSEGASLVNTLNAGSEALEDMKRKADELGLTFTDLEAERVEKANDAIHEMTSAWAGLKQELSIGLAPAIQQVVELLEEAIKKKELLGPSLSPSRAGGFGMRAGIEAGAAGTSPSELFRRIFGGGPEPGAEVKPKKEVEGMPHVEALNKLNGLIESGKNQPGFLGQGVPKILSDFASRQANAFGEVAGNLRWQVQTGAALQLHNLPQTIGRAITDWVGEPGERKKEVAEVIPQAAELFAKESRLMTGARSRNDPRLEEMRKMRETMEAEKKAADKARGEQQQFWANATTAINRFLNLGPADVEIVTK